LRTQEGIREKHRKNAIFYGLTCKNAVKMRVFHMPASDFICSPAFSPALAAGQMLVLRAVLQDGAAVSPPP
jgi:hypothetical protein